MADDRFTIDDTPLAGLKRVRRVRMGDERGFLQRLFDRDVLAAAGFDGPIVQINHTLTRRRGAVRGLHFQHPPHGEVKLVCVLAGEIMDVAVDLRQGSSTLGRWHGERLSADNGVALLIPRGFAHGFQALTDDCQLVYLHSAAYYPDAEDGLDALDPGIGIAWPLPVVERSARDERHPRLPASYLGISV